MRGRLGPFSLTELRRLHLGGVIDRGTIITTVPVDPGIEFGALWEQQATSATSGTSSRGQEETFARRTRDDLRTLLPHLTVPLDELRNFRWLQNRRSLAIAAIGLSPLVIYALFREPSQVINAYWAMALYFSTLWALFFYYVFPTSQVSVGTSVFSFFITAVVSVSSLLLLYSLWPLSLVSGWAQSSNWLIAWAGNVFGVGVLEEFCKALVLLILVRRIGPLHPQALLFYGLMSGLGFGLFEGVKYQSRENLEFAFRTSGQPDAYFAAEYYLLNLIRLTTLPFLHAIWTGMAGYFIGFASQFPARRRGLAIVAIGLPAVLHGTYNTFGGALGLIVALISVLALNLYLAKSVEFERLLQNRSD